MRHPVRGKPSAARPYHIVCGIERLARHPKRVDRPVRAPVPGCSCRGQGAADHVEAGARPGADHALGRQTVIGLHDSRGGDAHHAGEPAYRRQAIAGTSMRLSSRRRISFMRAAMRGGSVNAGFLLVAFRRICQAYGSAYPYSLIGSYECVSSRVGRRVYPGREFSDRRRAMSQVAKGWINGFVGVLIFSGSLPATRLAVGGFSPLFLTSARAVIAALLGAAFLALFRQARPVRRDVRLPADRGRGVVVGFPLLTAVALQHITSAHSVVFIGLLPLSTAAFAVLCAPGSVRGCPSGCFQAPAAWSS